MLDDEGSILVEGEGDEEGSVSEESVAQPEAKPDQTESKPVDAKEEKPEQKEGEETDSTLTNTDTEGEKQLTEKGTKLDPNPLSRVNQELANERAKIRQYEEVLNNPTLLESYVQTIKKEGPVAPKSTEPEMRVEDIKTIDDLHAYERQREEKFQAKIQELNQTIATVKRSQEDTGVADRVRSDITTVRELYPELNPKSDMYNEGLDNAVGKLYEKMDFDPKSNRFLGKSSLREVADIVMGAANIAKKNGSEAAQTEVREKRSGKAVSGANKAPPDETNMTASQLIASRIKAARGRI